MRLTVAKVRVRLAQIIQRKLLGSMVGKLPGTALRSLEEVWGWEAVKPHVRTMRTLSAPTTQYYAFLTIIHLTFDAIKHLKQGWHIGFVMCAWLPPTG